MSRNTFLRFCAVAAFAAVALLSAGGMHGPLQSPVARADEPPNGGKPSGIGILALIGPQVPLTQSFSQEVRGDYVAAGIGMRNKGFGTINIALPAGSTKVKAFLYWQIIRDTAGSAPATGTMNGTGITGTLLGSSGSPCWGGTLIDVFRADVTSIAVNGANVLTNFPSGDTDGHNPFTPPTTFPLLEGASLVVVFQNPAFDFNTVVIKDGAQTFDAQTVATSFGNFTAAPSNATDQAAQTTYIVGDGQAIFAGDQASFNSTIVAGPTSAVKPADAFDGADGIAFYPTTGLWDTLNLNVSSFFTPGVATPASADITAGTGTDCLTWGAQVLSVKTHQAAGIDIKPGSFPNSINLGNKGVIPVAILSTPSFNATTVNPATVCFGDAENTAQRDCTEAHGMGHPEDVNGDGLMDLVLHYETDQTGIDPTDTQACLTGVTFANIPVEGCDSVRIVGS